MRYGAPFIKSFVPMFGIAIYPDYRVTALTHCHDTILRFLNKTFLKVRTNYVYNTLLLKLSNNENNNEPYLPINFKVKSPNIRN